jgi:hypothetical protein
MWWMFGDCFCTSLSCHGVISTLRICRCFGVLPISYVVPYRPVTIVSCCHAHMGTRNRKKDVARRAVKEARRVISIVSLRMVVHLYGIATRRCIILLLWAGTFSSLCTTMLTKNAGRGCFQNQRDLSFTHLDYSVHILLRSSSIHLPAGFMENIKFSLGRIGFTVLAAASSAVLVIPIMYFTFERTYPTGNQ